MNAGLARKATVIDQDGNEVRLPKVASARRSAHTADRQLWTSTLRIPVGGAR